jgi:hypothetical protein
MRTILLIIVLMLVDIGDRTLLAQMYFRQIGDSLLENGNVKEAIIEYKRVYIVEKPEHFGAYNVAAAFSVDQQFDSAFKYLFLSLLTDTTVRACTDPYFLPLRNDKRWPVFADSVIAVVKAKNPNPVANLNLARRLWEMGAWDQAYYYEINIAEKKLGRDSPVVWALWNAKSKINTENVRLLDSILLIHGWPSIPMVGYYASQSAFLIVQHSDLERQTKHLPAIKLLCDSGKVSCSDYALMYDRTQILQDKQQLYGSQLRFNEKTGQHEFFPIEDEKNVNVRREQMGLGPIEEYAEYFGIKYEFPK